MGPLALRKPFWASFPLSWLSPGLPGTWLQVKRGDERAIWLPIERVDILEDVDVETLPIARPTNERG